MFLPAVWTLIPTAPIQISATKNFTMKVERNFLKSSIYIKIELFVTCLHVLFAPMRFSGEGLWRWCQRISQAPFRSCLFSPLREAQAGIIYPGVRRRTLKHPTVFPCQIYQLSAKPNTGEIWTCHTIRSPAYVCSRSILSDRIRGERGKRQREQTKETQREIN